MLPGVCLDGREISLISGQRMEGKGEGHVVHQVNVGFHTTLQMEAQVRGLVDEYLPDQRPLGDHCPQALLLRSTGHQIDLLDGFLSATQAASQCHPCRQLRCHERII